MTSVYRRLRSESAIERWSWFRTSGAEFAKLADASSDASGTICEVRSDLSAVVRVFIGKETPLFIIAEPEPASPSPFSFQGDRLTIGFTTNRNAAEQARAALSVRARVSDSANSKCYSASALELLIQLAFQNANQLLERRCLQATLPDPRLDKEGEEFFECIGSRIGSLFNPDYIEIQPTTPSVFWPDRSDGWSWIHAGRDDFQWPVSLTSELEWELYRAGKLRFIESVSASSEIVLTEQPGSPGLESGILLPMVYRGRYQGLIKLFYSRSFLHTPDEEALIRSFQEGISLLFDRSREHLRTQRMAMIDGLTNLYNHRFFLRQLRTEFQRSLRYHGSITMVMIDIDDFKSYNDSYGHQAGNRVLAWVAQTIRRSVRDIDFVARYGGEEFALILPEIKAEAGLIVAEKIRKAVSSETIVTDEGERLRPITVSCGVTDNSKARRPEDMIEQADQALYWVKRNGRSLVRLALTDS